MSIRALIVGILALLASSTSGAALASDEVPSAPPDPVIDAIIARADSLRMSRRVDLAVALFDSALASLATHESPDQRLTLHTHRLRTLLQGGEARSALAEARGLAASDAASADPRLRLNALYWQAGSLDALGEREGVSDLYREVISLAEAIPDSELLARGEMRLARRLRIEGDLDGAIGHLDRADLLFDALGNEHQLVANLGLRGLIEITRGHDDLALAAWRDCAASSAAWPDRSTHVNCLNNIAVQEALFGDPGVAMECWRAVRKIALEGGSPWRVAMSPTMNLAVMLASFGRFEEADALLDEALALAREKGYADVEGELLATSAEVAEVREDWPRALRLRRAAREIQRDRGDAMDHFFGIHGLGVALAALDSVEAAIALLPELDALRANLPVAQEIELDRWAGDVLARSGRSAAAFTRIRAALARADDVGAVRQRLQSMLSLVDAHRDLEQADSMIVWLERAAALHETVREIPTDPRWREQRNELAHRIHPELARLRRDSGTTAPDLHVLLQPYKARTLLERVRRPGESVPERSDAIVPMAELQGEVLREGEVFLDYVLGPHGSLVFAITRESCEVFTLDSAPLLEPQLRAFTDLLRTPPRTGESDEFVRKAAQQIRARVVPEGAIDRAGIRRVLVFPDGALVAVAFALLLDPLEVQRVPSAQLLARSRRVHTAPGDGSVLAMVPAGPGLPGARAEVATLSARFDGVTVRELGSGPDLRSENGWQGATVLHIASHARLVDHDPWRSGILFDATETDSTGDAARVSVVERPRQITAAEVAEMSLDASLVVLSGCETMGGERFRGAGVLGLSTAFLSAGAHEVLATLWRVDDGSTRRFMDRFYAELGAGTGTVAALSATQRALRDDPATAHPFHWAGFVLVGDDPGNIPLRLRRNAALWPLVLAALVVLAGAGLLRRSRKVRTSSDSRISSASKH